MRLLSVDPGRKHLGLCVLDADDADRSGMQDRITMWKVIEISTDAAALKQTLDDTLNHGDYDAVVIERQPPKNATMKRFEHLFEMYFAMHGFPVYVMDARHKLTFASHTPHWPGERPIIGGKDKGSWSYIKRKKISVSVVTKFMAATESHHPAFREVFEKAQKKDDFADALLQAQAYAHTVRYVQADTTRTPKIRPFPKPRPPKPGGGRMTKANVAFFLQECETVEAIEDVFARNDKHSTKLKNALITFFGSPDTFLQSRVQYEEKKRRKTLKQCPSPGQPLSA